MGAIIEVKGLRKEFRIAKRKEGAFGAIRTLFSSESIAKTAVRDVSFAIGRGEMVGYIGPNGAGKSTTIKMLTGILVPSGGEVRVRGIVPYVKRVENAQQTPVRQLSLGQRMRADIGAALLHDPEILYLDEPTIGLDVVAKEKIRAFIKEINRDRGVTVILTTHDMQDIEKLCERMILIDKGMVIYDGPLAQTKERFGKLRTLVVDLEEPFGDGELSASQLIARVSETYRIRDLTVEEPEIEGIISRIYQEGI